MGVYLKIFHIAFKQQFTYRLNSYISTVSALFGMIVLVSIWSTLFHQHPEVRGVRLPTMIDYVVVSSFVTGIIDCRIHFLLGSRVQDGSLSLDFVKPVELKWHMFAEQAGENAFRLLVHVLPACVLVALIWGFQAPTQPLQIALFLISLALGLLLHFYFNFILGLIVFYLESPFFIDWVSDALFKLFAGSFVPLWFYPSWLYSISMALPFQLFAFEPISIFVGQTSISGAERVIMLQLVWLVVFIVLERLLWQKARTLVDIHGG